MKNLATVIKDVMCRLHAKFGLDVCGEGGEYETFVLDCLAFKKRIEVDSSEVVLDEEGDHSVGNLRVTSHRVVVKSSIKGIELIDSGQMLLMSGIEFINSCNLRQNHIHNIANSKKSKGFTRTTEPSIIQLLPPSTHTHRHSGLGQTSLVLPLNTEATVQEQVHSVMTQLQSLVESHNASLLDVVFVHLYISNMDLFMAVNAEYCKWFGRNPPSRSCVAVCSFELVFQCSSFLILLLKGYTSEWCRYGSGCHVFKRFL